MSDEENLRQAPASEPDMPNGFILHGVNGNQLRVDVRKPRLTSDYRLILRTGSNTASVGYAQLNELISAITANFSRAVGYREHTFPGATSLSIFGGEIDGVRYLALLCGGKTVRLDANGVEMLVTELARLKVSVRDLIRARCEVDVVTTTGA